MIHPENAADSERTPSRGRDFRSQSGGISVLQVIDLFGQIVLSVLAWTPVLSTVMFLDDSELLWYRLPILIWQGLSLAATAIVKEGEPGYRAHTTAFWPVMLTLVLGVLLIPVKIGYFVLWAWQTAALCLSLPYLLLTLKIVVLGLSGPHRRRSVLPLRHLFRIKQIDLIAQAACLAIPVAIVLHGQRPLNEALVLGFPLLAGWQLVSGLVHLILWRDFAPWRSLIRIPCLVLQAVFVIAVIANTQSNASFSWQGLLRLPNAQVLTAAYLIITILEWDQLSTAMLRVRRHFS